MKAAFFAAIGKLLRIGKLEIPKAKADRILLKACRSGICGGDPHMTAEPVFGIAKDDVFGHESSGDAIATDLHRFQEQRAVSLGAAAFITTDAERAGAVLDRRGVFARHQKAAVTFLSSAAGNENGGIVLLAVAAAAEAKAREGQCKRKNPMRIPRLTPWPPASRLPVPNKMGSRLWPPPTEVFDRRHPRSIAVSP